MKRNISFLTILLFALTACSSDPSAEKGTREKKEIALQLYSLRADIKEDYHGTIAKVGEMGYTAIEAAGYSDGQFYGRAPTEFKNDIEGAGLVVLSSHTARPLTPEELKSKDFSTALTWWDEAIAAHKEAGMKYIVTPWMEVPKTIADLQTYCEYYNEVGKKAKENELLFGYHNHDFEFTKIADQVMYDYMIENTDPELVFFQMDVYWVVKGGHSPVDYFDKYPGRFTLLHIKDNKELGQSGMVGFDAIFKNTDTAGTKYLVVEVEKYNFEPEESVKRSLDYLLELPSVKASYSN